MKVDFKFDIADTIVWKEHGVKKKGLVVALVFDHINGISYDIIMLKGDRKYEVVNVKEGEWCLNKVEEEEDE
ncbi:MAG: hypothetical protein ACOCRO_04790 [Halanaerobiales bacterium]